MRPKSKLKRKAFFVDARVLHQARKVLGARSDAEAVRISIEQVAEMEAYWRFMAKSRSGVRPSSFGTP